MTLVFPGTRGYIDASTRRHRRHTCLQVSYEGRDVAASIAHGGMERVGR